MISILLDTNLLINQPDLSQIGEPLDDIDLRTSTLCIAEYQEGVYSDDPVTAATTVVKMVEIEQAFGEGIPFGRKELAAYRAVCAAVVATGRQLNRARRIDLMIAATALANGMTLATRNTEDFAGLERVVPVIAL